MHVAGHRVFATARNPSKLVETKAAGIETLTLDVLSDDSIKQCVGKVCQLTGGSLDMLVDNAGATYYFPLSETWAGRGMLFVTRAGMSLRLLQVC